MLLPQFHAKTNICQHKTTEANTSNIKECVHFSLANRPRTLLFMRLGSDTYTIIVATNEPQTNLWRRWAMAQRNLRIEDDLKRQIETVRRTRGYRSSSAFMIEAIEEKLGRIEAAESMSEAEQRLTTDLSRITRHVNGIHNSVQALYALTDTLTKYIA